MSDGLGSKPSHGVLPRVLQPRGHSRVAHATTAKGNPRELLRRIAPPNPDVLNTLGLLSEFPGTWVGSGFNLIALPDKQNNQIFRLQLNTTIETLEFTPIGGAVPNRGSEQNDIFLHGVHYLQRVSDATTHAPLHIEPGIWLRVPPTQEPQQAETYVRQSTIPHGDSLIAQSTFFKEASGGPILNHVDASPFLIKPGVAIPGLNQVPNPDPVNRLGYTDPYFRTPLPAGLPQGLDPAQVISNPVLLLSEAIRGQDIVKTVVIEVSSASSGGIVNIPFVVKNANAIQLDAIFWVEHVVAGDIHFSQLQYVQRVILDFDGIHWPHVSVATLVKQ